MDVEADRLTVSAALRLPQAPLCQQFALIAPFPTIPRLTLREERMADSVYKVIELIGTSSESWEKAARTAVERAAESLRDLR
ncbi:MAG: dodecin family protein, partial [Microvirga sp.]